MASDKHVFDEYDGIETLAWERERVAALLEDGGPVDTRVGEYIMGGKIRVYELLAIVREELTREELEVHDAK